MSDPMLPPGTNFCKCPSPSCGEYFTNVGTFDMHRKGNAENRRCSDPHTLVDKHGKARLRLTGKGYWARPGGVYKGARK